MNSTYLPTSILVIIFQSGLFMTPVAKYFVYFRKYLVKHFIYSGNILSTEFEIKQQWTFFIITINILMDAFRERKKKEKRKKKRRKDRKTSK